jgi:methionyl-tRNA formyltransferase
MKRPKGRFFISKTMNSKRIVFMGTPEFAVTSLQALVNAKFHVVGVVTVPDKPAGRGQKVQQSAVKIFADNHHLPTLQPIKLKDADFLSSLANWQADLFVVVAFRMLPEVVWKMPPLGTINLHGSLLPKYRGAAPIHWAVVNGEHETGVTTFFINEQIDTGEIIERTTISIGPDETTGELHDRMMVIGAQTLCHTVQLILDGTAQSKEQLDSEACHAPKLSREIAQINWKNTGLTIHNFIRGMSPYPCAWTIFKDKTLKVFQGYHEMSGDVDLSQEIGELKDGKLRFRTTDGWYYPTEVQWEGKKRMSIDEFMRGLR